MDNDINFVLDTQTSEKLAAFGELLKKDTQTMRVGATRPYDELEF